MNFLPFSCPLVVFNPCFDIKMAFRLMFLLVLGVYFAPSHGSVIQPPLKIAAFNVRTFGQAKLNNPDVMTSLIKIFRRYDITLIQEIKDVQHEVIETVINTLNPSEFANITSIRLGTTSSQEQYSFIYRKSVVSVTTSYQSLDYTKFERPPFAVRFHAPNAELEDFGIMALHSKPTAAKEEIEALFLEYSALKSLWNLQNILLAGDFNADCDFLSQGTPSLSINIPDEFDWLISDYEDTTATTTDCSYDRFVAFGPELRANVVPYSAKPFKFDDAFGLTQEQAEDVSDHYPVEVELLGKVDEVEVARYGPQMTISIKDPQSNQASVVQEIARTQKYKGEGYIVTYEHLGSTKTHIMATKTDVPVNDVMSVVEEFRTLSESKLFQPSIIDVVREFLASELLSGQHYVYGMNLNAFNLVYDVQFRCEYRNSYACEIRFSKSLVNQPVSKKRDFVEGKLARLLKKLKIVLK